VSSAQNLTNIHPNIYPFQQKLRPTYVAMVFVNRPSCMITF